MARKKGRYSAVLMVALPIVVGTAILPSVADDGMPGPAPAVVAPQTVRADAPAARSLAPVQSGPAIAAPESLAPESLAPVSGDTPAEANVAEQGLTWEAAQRPRASYAREIPLTVREILTWGAVALIGMGILNIFVLHRRKQLQR